MGERAGVHRVLDQMQRQQKRQPESPRVAPWVFALGATALGMTAVAAAAIGGAAVLARTAVMPRARIELPCEVVRIDDLEGNKVVWLRGHEADQPGRYSLFWESGCARVGDVLARADGLVARAVIQVDAGELAAGMRCRVTGWWYPSVEVYGEERDEVRDVKHIDLSLAGGVAPAWVLRPAKRVRFGSGSRWAIHVHGRGAKPAETLRGVTPLARAGVINLVMSYRNDDGAPAGEGGRYGFGLSEAEDVDTAIAYALAQGATRVTLVGWSMGGTAALVAATRGQHRGVIDGLILDSPAVDWAALLQYQTRLRKAPGIVAHLGIAMLERGIVAADVSVGAGVESAGVDFSALSAEAFAASLQVPTLIHASTGDTFVPSSGAERLAALRPDLVQLRHVDIGEHVKLWNVDAERWEQSTEQFARALPRPAWRG